MIAPLRHAPLLTIAPSRGAGLSRSAARAMLGAAMLALLAALAIGGHAAWPVPDPSLPAGIVDGVRHGGRFLDVAADAGRQSGTHLAPTGLPLPAWAVVTGALPPLGVVALLGVASAGVLLAWWAALADATRGLAGPTLGTVLGIAGLLGTSRPSAAALPEAWAGLLVALSLARWRPGAVVEAAAFALAAAVLAKAALIFVAVMALADSGDRRALACWAAVAGLAVAVIGLHLHAVAALAGPFDLPAPMPTREAAGLAVPAATWLGDLAPALGVPLFAAALIGWAGWRDRRAARATGFLLLLSIMLALVPHGDLTAWGFLAAPIALIGLLALPDLLRDLVLAARDRRRLTVTRLAR